MIDYNENLNADEEDLEQIESLDLRAKYYNNLVDRYFTKFYLDKDTEKEQYIFIHTNGIVMCGLGLNHKIVKNPNLKITEIKDLQKVIKTSGKRKHGAHILNDNEYIIQFIYEEGNTQNEKSDSKENFGNFSFSPRVKGKLLETNTNIITNFDLVKNSPEKNGYICFILLEPKAVQSLREKLEKLQI
jgi:hypothetical protein